MVFNIWPLADANGNTLAMMSNQADTRGVAIGYNVKQLPALSLWKNTDTEADGYVTGIEPGTGFPYNHTIENEQGRIMKIGPGESRSFDVEFRVLGSEVDVQKAAAEIDAIQAGRAVVLVPEPLAIE